jgi:hypothetical protein
VNSVHKNAFKAVGGFDLDAWVFAAKFVVSIGQLQIAKAVWLGLKGLGDVFAKFVAARTTAGARPDEEDEAELAAWLESFRTESAAYLEHVKMLLVAMDNLYDSIEKTALKVISLMVGSPFR